MITITYTGISGLRTATFSKPSAALQRLTAIDEECRLASGDKAATSYSHALIRAEAAALRAALRANFAEVLTEIDADKAARLNKLRAELNLKIDRANREYDHEVQNVTTYYHDAKDDAQARVRQS